MSNSQNQQQDEGEAIFAAAQVAGSSFTFSDDEAKRFEHRVSKTGIVCTIGPATNSVEILVKLVNAGMKVARLNFSHGDHKFHASIIQNVRKAAEITKRHVAIMLDTKGPEIRTSKLAGEENEIQLNQGDKYVFTNDQSVLADTKRASTTYDKLPQTVNKGDLVLVDDGLISFRVDSVTQTEVHCTILNSGKLGGTKGVNLPGAAVQLPAVTEKDKKDIAFGVEQKVDFIAASFIRKAENVVEIRNLPGVKDLGIMIISKIENQEGLNNFEDILAASDGIMVARGDLGVEIPIEKVATAQKMMIKQCNYAGKPVITATQMLDSMISYPRPTRAEATDVANAVFDGTDCVMLSGETAKGKYPVVTVKTMRQICLEAEKVIEYRQLYTNLRKHIINKTDGNVSVPESICSSAVKTSWDLSAAIIICLSDSGNTVRFVSKYRPHCPILCITSTARTARQVVLSRSVTPLLVESMKGTDALIAKGMKYAFERGILKDKEYCVTTSGFIEGTSGSTNIMRVNKFQESGGVEEREK